MLALTFAVSPAGAQSAAAEQPTAADPAQPAVGLEEIIVTAQRRSESLQRAAIAVTALATELIRGQVSSPESLGKLVPSVVIGTGGGGANQVAVRGIGTLASNGLTENVVAFNLDGVYLSRPAAANGLYFDLERIEVLKGPQGTLYGRNATAGAINMISARPDFSFGGYVDAQAGNHDLYATQAALNVPLSDAVALRVAGQGIQRSGYFSDGYSDQEQYSGRASLLAKPNADVSVLLSADYAHIGGMGAGGALVPYVDPSDPYVGPSDPRVQRRYTGFPPFPLPVVRPDGFNDLSIWGVTGNFEWRTAAGTLTVLPAYRRSNLNYRHYSGGFEVNTRGEVSNERTAEVRFATPEEDRLRAVLGAYYFKETGEFLLSFRATPQPASVTDIRSYDTRSLAAFAQTTFDLTNAIRLIGGLRYSDEKKAVQGFANGGAPVVGNLADSNVSVRTGVEADLAANSLLYATVATGFKAGGFYASLAPNTFRPEKLTAYTLGSKNRFVDNRLQLNLETYYWKYDDKQVSHIGPVRPGGFGLITENAGQATLYGFELETSFLVTSDDLVSGSLLYNHTKYDSFVYTQTLVTGPPITTCAVRPNTPASVIVDCTGNRLSQSPRWSANARIEHTFRLRSDDRLVLAAAGASRSNYFVGDEYLPGQFQGAYVTGDMDFAYHAAKDRWSVSAFVRNVSDEAVKSTSVVQPLLRLPVTGLYPPRTYGVRAVVKF